MNEKIFKKKIKGGGSTYLATLITIPLILVLFVGLIYVQGEALKRNEVQRIHRKYLLSMEIEGYLSDTNEALLRAELAGEGVVNIDLSGTDKVPVGYGSKVRLVIKGDLPVDGIHFGGGFGERQEDMVHVDMDDTGTALY